MIETYSKNITVNANATIPFNNIALVKGCSVQQQGASTLQFNKSGIYEVNCSASAVASTAGNITIQLQKNGEVQPQALASATAADTTSIYDLSFVTLVQVPYNNCNCNCAISPTTIDILNAGQTATFDTIDIVVTKIC